MTDYLRNRPFLAVEISQRPAPGVNTGKRGWQNEEGALQSFEKVSFLDRINDRSRYAVIIDIINSAVIANASSRSDSEVMAVYLSNYREQVTKALTVWAGREASRLEADASNGRADG